jgi:hypothetical protein
MDQFGNYTLFGWKAKTFALVVEINSSPDIAGILVCYHPTLPTHV